MPSHKALLLLAAGLLALAVGPFIYRVQNERAQRVEHAVVQAESFRATGKAGWASRTRLTASERQAGQIKGVLPPFAETVLDLRAPLRHGEYLWSEQGVPQGPIRIWIDLRRQMISVFQGGSEIGTAVIVYGAPQMASPVGSYPILSKVRDYHSVSYDAAMPYALFITNTGVALHGSPMASDHATHGCVGLPLPFARALFEVASTGDIVTIVKSEPDDPVDTGL